MVSGHFQHTKRKINGRKQDVSLLREPTAVTRHSNQIRRSKIQAIPSVKVISSGKSVGIS